MPRGVPLNELCRYSNADGKRAAPGENCPGALEVANSYPLEFLGVQCSSMRQNFFGSFQKSLWILGVPARVK